MYERSHAFACVKEAATVSREYQAAHRTGLRLMTHRMWGFPEIPDNLKWIVLAVPAAAVAIYLVRNFSK